MRGLVVAEQDQGYGAGGHTSYASIVSFTTVDGSEVRGTPRGGMDLGLPVVGREAPVWYDPENPRRFEARIHALDRAGSMLLLSAVLPAVLSVASFAS